MTTLLFLWTDSLRGIPWKYFNNELKENRSKPRVDIYTNDRIKLILLHTARVILLSNTCVIYHRFEENK